MSGDASTRTVSAPGRNDVPTNSNLHAIPLTLSPTPPVTPPPSRTWTMYCSPPMMRTGAAHASSARALGANRVYLSSCQARQGMEKGRNGCRLLDWHLDWLRLGGRLLLGDADLEHAVLQVRCRQVGLDLRGEPEGGPERLVRPLLVVVVLLLLFPGAVRLRTKFDSVRGQRQVHILLRDARELGPDDELRAVVDQIDEGLTNLEAGFLRTAEGGSPEAALEGPAEVVEPAVHFLEPVERRGRYPRKSLLFLAGLLVLAHHANPPPWSVQAAINVYAVLYKYSQ